MAKKTRGNTKHKGKGSQGLNRKIGEEYLEKASSKAGVQTLDSGLMYEVVLEGDEAGCPDEFSQVEVHQRIKLVDGTVVRDTFANNTPDKFPLTEAIEGLQEGLALMKKGSRFVFHIPDDLAWGKRGAGDKIGPYSVLIADVRLVDFW